MQVKFAGVESDNEEEQQDINVEAGDVRVAVFSEHEVAGGLIGYGNIQMNLDDLTGEGGLSEASADFDGDGSLTDDDPIELDSSATVSADDIYVGIKGGFGDIRLGDIPLAVEYGQLANDIHDVGTTVPDGISYTGTFGGFGLGLNFSPEEDSDMVGAGVNFNIAGFGIGLGFEDRALGASYAVGATYAIAGFSLGAHYWAGETDFDPDLVLDTSDDAPEDEDTFNNFDIDDTESYAVQVGYSIAGVSLGVTYSVLEGEEQEEDAEAATAVDESIIRFDAGYDLGGGLDISTRIQNKIDDAAVPTAENPDADADVLEYRVMLTKTF